MVARGCETATGKVKQGFGEYLEEKCKSPLDFRGVGLYNNGAVKRKDFTGDRRRAGFFKKRGSKAVTKNFEQINLLLDFYGSMLTERQRSFLEYYYEDDLSLAEIAENEGITRQGVRDAIKRAEGQLYQMEERLGLAKRFAEMQKGLKEIDEAAESIYECNMRTGLSREINEACVKIRFLAGALSE